MAGIFSWFAGRPRRRQKTFRRASTNRRIERLEERTILAADPLAAAVGFLTESANLYNVSRNFDDAAAPSIFYYRDDWNGGTYGEIDAAGMTLDGDDPGAGQGATSFRAEWTGGGVNGWFQFRTSSTTPNRPRDLTSFGNATSFRFLARGDDDNQQIRVKIFRTLPANQIAEVTSQTIDLTTGWDDYRVTIPGGLKPSDLHAVQFVIGDELNPGNRTFWVDEVRVNTSGIDRLRTFQSYRPGGVGDPAAATDTPEYRDARIYPNHSFLYDDSLAVKALLRTDSAQAKQIARDVTDGLLAARLADGSYYNQRNSGHVLQGDGSPRGPLSNLRTLGDNAWFGLALLDVYRDTGNPTYLTRAQEISDWANTHLAAPAPLNGYYGGFVGTTMLDWRSTEHNIDAYELNQQIAAELVDLGDPAAAEYQDRAAHAAQFVLAMFDDTDGKFWTGTRDDTGNLDDINTSTVPLDAQLWSAMTLGQSAAYGDAIDWTRPVTWAEQMLVRTDGPYTGFTFSLGVGSKVWFEGLAHAAVLYDLLGESAKYDQAVATLRAAQEDHPRGDDRGLVAASSDGLHDPSFQDIYFDSRRHVGATSWLAFAEMRESPFRSLVPPETAEITVTPTSGLFTTEVGGTAQFSVVLTSQPAAAVTIGIASGNPAEGMVDKSQLVFTPTDWNLPQTVTVTGVDDDFDDGDAAFTILTAPATSSDDDYNGLNPADVAVTNVDDDVQGLVVSPTALSVNENGTNTVTVKLSAQPLAEVTVNVAHASGDADLAVQDGAVLIFTPQNWNSEQVVTLSAAEDADAANGSATFVVSSVGLTDVSVTADEIDNDVLTASPWRNPDLREDVDDNGEVNIQDLLALVAFLRNNEIDAILAPPDDELAPPPFGDLDGDNLAEIADLLALVTFLRTPPAA